MATIGLSKPYYAIYAEAGGVVSYSDGAVMGKATEANISIETTEDNNLYGDNGLAETDRRFANGTLTLSTTDLSQEVSKAILGLTEQAITGIDGVTDTSVKELVYDDTQVTPYLGVGFIIKKKVNGAYKWRGVVLPKIMFSVPEDAATTQGESIEWQTPELTGAIMRDDSATHAWKRKPPLLRRPRLRLISRRGWGSPHENGQYRDRRKGAPAVLFRPGGPGSNGTLRRRGAH